MTGASSGLGDRIRSLPGMERLLAALEGLDPAFLAGGSVRDLMRGAANVDLDLAIEGDAGRAASELAERLGGEAWEHERFGTATVRAPEVEIDLARTRRERYPTPGALPEVEPAPLEEDLGRRDFTVNAMAAALAPRELGRVIDPHGGARDLEAGAIRVLHNRSFVDDPTRLLRAVRYETRLGFTIEPATEALARDAARSEALRAVSGPRVRHELLDLLAEPEAGRAVDRLGELGLDRALHPRLAADAGLVASAALGAVETGADRVLAELAALVCEAPEALAPWLDDLGLQRPRRERVARAASAAPALVERLRAELLPSELRALLDPEPPEALALALARGAPADPILRYVRDLRDVRLEVTGADLIAAGVPGSPAIGHALARTLAMKLDGELAGRDEELSAALELAREEGRET